jgi:ribosomal protein L11 methyltransferase
MTDADTLLQLTLEVPTDLADDLTVALGDLSPEGFEQDDGDLQHAPGASAPPPGRVRFTLYGPGEEGERLRAGLTALVASLGENASRVSLAVEARPNQNWREVWKVHFQIQHIDRFVIRPSWLDYAPAAGEHVIHLDPGSAFGTGLHESTRLCLRALAALADAGERPATVVDFGCGTGILALAAGLLFPAATAWCLDNDPLALVACRENAERNGQAERQHLGEVLDATVPLADLMLANVSRPVLLAHADALVTATAPGGVLVLSGLLAGEEVVISEAFAARGAPSVRVTREHDWVAVTCRRGGAAR